MLMSYAVNYLAWAYYLKKDLDQSLKSYLVNLEFAQALGQKEVLANVCGNIVNIYRDWKRYSDAVDYYKKSIQYAKGANDYYNLSWLYDDMSLMFANMGDYKDAYENYKFHKLYSDSLQTSNYRKMIIAAQTEFEAERNARNLELLSMKLEKNRYILIGLGALLGLLLIISVLVIRQNRYKAKQSITAMDHKISELTQTNLRQQMNPHFIFNTLNSIQYYVFQNDKMSSNNYMSKFASLMRRTLENSRHTAIPIKEELDALELYLELESLRFKEKFDWQITVDDEIDTVFYKIPTMLIQPYVENAITHGLMNKEGKGKLLVDLKLADHSIICTIEDNGIGRAKALEMRDQKNQSHISLGTTITESRLKLVNELYGKNMKVSYTDLADEGGNPSGTKVQINIPIIT